MEFMLAIKTVLILLFFFMNLSCSENNAKEKPALDNDIVLESDSDKSDTFLRNDNYESDTNLKSDSDEIVNIRLSGCISVEKEIDKKTAALKDLELAFLINDNVVYRATTDTNGCYAIEILPGQYSLYLSHPSYLPFSKKLNTSVDSADNFDISLSTIPKGSFIIVRHANMDYDTDKINLTSDGKKRGDILSVIAKEAGVEKIYSTNCCRTTQTALESSISIGAEISLIENSHCSGFPKCNPEIKTVHSYLNPPIIHDEKDGMEKLAKFLRENNGDKTSLIVLHSDTTTELVEKIMGNFECPKGWRVIDNKCIIPDEDFSNMYVIYEISGKKVLNHFIYGEGKEF